MGKWVNVQNVCKDTNSRTGNSFMQKDHYFHVRNAEFRLSICYSRGEVQAQDKRFWSAEDIVLKMEFGEEIEAM